MWARCIYITNIGPTCLQNSLLFSYQIKTKELHRSFYTKPGGIQNDGRITRKWKRPEIAKAVYEFRAFAEDFFNMSELKQSQLKVMAIKDELQKSSDRKREILFELNKIRRDFVKCHTEICNTVWGTQNYIDLVKEENALLKMEENTILELNQVDSLERRSFNNLAFAINDTYEKEKIHSHTLRMWGLIATLIGSLLSLVTSTIAFYYLNKSNYKEGWGSYFKRHSLGVYRYFYPRSK